MSGLTKLMMGVVLVWGVSRSFGQTGEGAAKQPVKLPNCPVMTEDEANLAVSVESDAGPVFFCCKGCVGKYKADPKKYATKVAAQQKTMADRSKVQVSCPVSRDPVDPKIALESGGKKVLFCSNECMSKYQKDPGQYAVALTNSFTYQTKCPVMGKEIDPKASLTTADGTKIFFCCNGCDKKLLAEPAKYLPNLVAQGYTVEPKALIAAPAKAKDPHDHKDHDHD